MNSKNLLRVLLALLVVSAIGFGAANYLHDGDGSHDGDDLHYGEGSREMASSSDSNENAIQSDDKQAWVGANTCKTCHEGEYALWQGSDHHRSMLNPDEGSVLGRFDGKALVFQGESSRAFREGGNYMIETPNAEGVSKLFPVKYTFGYYPLQQYLVQTDNGKIQALNLAWDSRAESEGGQRWFDLQSHETVDAEHPFYWTKHFQNWNSRCADCHSTNLVRNFDANNLSFDTRYSEINVACEACHGAGKKHVDLAESDSLSPDDSGFTVDLSNGVQWQFSLDANIAHPVISDDKKVTDGPNGGMNHLQTRDINMCGACHSLRGPLQASPTPDQDYHQNYRLQLLNLSTYHADGQSREESFVLGSFLQSKMYHKGVTCGNCHNAHSGKLNVEGNALCAQCHKPDVYDVVEHHHHDQDSPGAQCVNCHMPAGTYMGVDKRRDHSFTIPRPRMSLDLGVPNACTQCHDDKDDQWASSNVEAWGAGTGKDHWAHLLHRAANNDVLVTRPLIAAIENQELPYLIRASLLEHLGAMPSRVSAETAQKALRSANPLLRRAAVSALRQHPISVRWQILGSYLNDENRAVRLQLAEVLADSSIDLPEIQKKQFAKLLTEYRAALSVSSDSVSTQLNIANLEMRLSNDEAAREAFSRALKIEPAYVPALLNFASYYHRAGEVDKEREQLLKAVQIAADSGAAQHSLGLHYVRAKQYELGLQHLELAVVQNDATPYYAYVHAVALENQGQLAQAISALESANIKWPNQYEILMTLVLYLEKSGETGRIPNFLAELSRVAPAAPPVQKLLKKYGLN